MKRKKTQIEEEELESKSSSLLAATNSNRGARIFVVVSQRRREGQQKNNVCKYTPRINCGRLQTMKTAAVQHPICSPMIGIIYVLGHLLWIISAKDQSNKKSCSHLIAIIINNILSHKLYLSAYYWWSNGFWLILLHG